MAKFTQVLKNKNFFLLWLGQIISQWGDRLGQMALIAFISTRAPGSSWQLAKLLSFTILPVFVIGPVAGAYVDRWDRRRTMFISDFIRGILILAIPLYFLYFKELLPTYIVIFIVFSIGRFFVPAKMSIIPELVHADHLLIANSLVNITGMLAAILGFGLSGILVEFLKAKGGFYLDSLSFFISGLLIFFISKTIIKKTDRYILKRMGRELAAVFRKSIFIEIKEGIIYLVKMKQMRFALIIFFVLWSAFGAVSVVIIVFIQQNLSSVTKHLGLLAMFLGIGLFLGSLLYGRLGHKVKQAKMIFLSLALSGVFLILFSLCLRFIPSFNLAACISLLLGFVAAPLVIICNTIIHKVSDNNMMGKVFSSLEIVMHLAFILFMFISSRLAEYIPRIWILIVAGIALIISGLLFVADKRKLQWLE